ncbi:MAG: MFS transporter [Gammaproteobacteria bacterium]|nr:MAG: MFS transporter [Gammaproteobacteria bacterium]
MTDQYGPRMAEMIRGWRVLLSSFLGVACGASPLPIYTIGVFAVPLAATFGWGRGDVMLATLPLTIGTILTVPLIGALTDRIGVKPVAMGALVGLSLSFCALAFTPDSLWVFYALWLLVGLVSAGSTPVTWTRAIVAWFFMSRGMALALILIGTGVAGFFLPIYASWLIETFGWRQGFIGVGLLPVVIALPVVWLLFQDSPRTAAASAANRAARQMASPSAQPATITDAAPLPPEQDGLSLREAMRGYRFWLLVIVILLVTVQTSGALTNLFPLLQDRGFAARDAATIAGTIGISVIVGRLMTGYLIDRFWAPGVALPLLALPAVACLILVMPEIPMPLAYAAAFMIGLAAGAETDVFAYVAARYFGLKHYGRIYGVFYAVFAFAAGFSPFVFGRVFDVTGSYNLVLYASAIMVVIGAILLLSLGRYPPRFAVTSSGR